MEYVLLIFVGLLAGVLGGLLGIGGSVIMIPAMVWIFGACDEAGAERIHQYMAAAMIVNFLLSLPSVWAHAKNKAIWPKVWVYLAAAALVGIVIGVKTSYMFAGQWARYLRWGLGGFFLYVIAQNLWRLADSSGHEGLDRRRVEAMPAWRKVLVGLPTGFLAGLLGLGGGSVAVPAQQVVLRMPLRNAIATSAAVIASVSWLGAITKNAALGAHGSVERSLVLAACLAPMAMIGSYAGGHLTHTLPTRIVRIVFVAIMLVSAWKMFTG